MHQSEIFKPVILSLTNRQLFNLKKTKWITFMIIVVTLHTTSPDLRIKQSAKWIKKTFPQLLALASNKSIFQSR